MNLNNLTHHNHCLHCHTYYSWLTHEHYKTLNYHIGVQFSFMQDHYWRLAQQEFI